MEVRLRRLRLTTIVLGVLTLLFGLMAFVPSAAPIKAPAVQKAAAANVESGLREIATRFSENLITFNYRTISQDIQRIQEDATPGFARQYQIAIRGDLAVFRRRVLTQRAVSTGEVKGAARVSLDEDTATMLVFATQTVRTAAKPKAETKFAVLELAFVKTPSGWKVDSARLPSTATEGSSK